MTNEYGTDVSYFKGKLKLVLAGLDNYTPEELSRELVRLALTASEHTADFEVNTRLSYFGD